MSACNNLKMRKSPLNAASGSKIRSNNWKSHEHKNRLGYGYAPSDNHQYGGQTQSGTDFIPLNVSTPLPEQKRHNWHGRGNNHRNSGSGGSHCYRNNYHSSPKANFNNSYSPYKLAGKPFYSQKKVYARKQVDISSYVDVKSFLEDPWADLVQKLNQSREINRIE